MSDRLPDQAERRRISTELDRSLLVEAGAGSGKTHEMAARMAAGVASGVYAIEQMAAVTFTRKAAAELRGRFQLALEAELTAAGAQPDRADRIRRALGSIERFFAGTIHAFCARLLRERPVEAGVSPGFSELDDVEDRLLRRQSWRDFRGQARAEGDADLLLLDEAGIRPSDLDDGFERVCLHEDVEFETPDRPAPVADAAWAALDTFWSDVESALPDPVPVATTCATQKKALQFRRAWRFGARSVRTPALLAELLEGWDFKPAVVQRQWASPGQPGAPIAKRVMARHEAFIADVVTPYLSAWRQYLYAPCVRVLMKARAHAAAERSRRNVLSFNDLLLLTARVLRERDDVRRALCDKYRHIFVDEFQDTDPIQAEIMVLLAPGIEGSQSTLFVVGDPKQSIYRFRRADIDVYNKMRGRLAGADGTGVVTLTTNFRSVPPICAWANRVFHETFPAEPTAWQPRFAPLVPRPRPAEHEPALYTLTVDASVEGRAAILDDEAKRIARYITTEVAAGRRRYEDFLVITRKKKPLHAYAQALEQLLVPIEVSGAGAFGESREVRVLAALLGALADPQDTVALVGVLRGPLFGLSDPQLFAWRQGAGYIGLFSELPSPIPTESAPVAAALEVLRRWFRWTRLLPAAAALDRILEDSGYLALASASPGGVEAGDLLHAVDRVRAAVEAGFTLAEAAESLEEDSDESSEVESLPLEPGRGGVVRLMNLHKAKGLEAAVVFLADPLGGFAPRVDISIERGDASTGYLQVTRKVGEFGRRVLAEPAEWTAHEASEMAYLDAEAGRLLYVAATRAKDMLVVGRYAKGGGSRRAWAAFDRFLMDAIELDVPAQASVPTVPAADLSPASAAAAAKTIELAHARVGRATWAATSATAEAKQFPRISSVGEDESGGFADPTRVMTAETPSRRADAGMAWGSLVHGLLEHAMRFPSATRDDLRRLARWLIVEEPALLAVIEQAIDTVAAVAVSEHWTAARASTEHHEEAPFSVLVTKAGEMPMVVSGTIDLVYRAGDAWCVVDYKTDVDGGGALAGRYAAQVAAYRDAWSKVSGGTVQSDVVPARSS
jgi:ATP-dependent helicase/nuclease subunit A